MIKNSYNNIKIYFQIQIIMNQLIKYKNMKDNNLIELQYQKI